MIRSMTGFAAISREEHGYKVGVTVKSVNHRFLDVVVKAPQALAAVEGRLKTLAQQRLARGRVELAVALEPTGELAREVVLDEVLLQRVVAALDGARAKGLIQGELTASDALRIPQVLDVRPKGETWSGEDPGVALVERMVAEAVQALVVMRETEGRFLRTDLDARIATLVGLVAAVEEQARAGQADLESRLRERIAGLPPELAGDASSLAQEIVRFVARSDVDEELTRLRGHVEHWRALADGPEPCGRKLDFLVQEMHREINTIGSKVEGPRVTELVIAAKAELERVREQVQNVE